MTKPQFDTSLKFGAKEIITLILGGLSVLLSHRDNKDTSKVLEQYYDAKVAVLEFRLAQSERWIEEIKGDHERATEQP